MLAKIAEILAEELGVEEDSITLETNIKDDLGADSLDLFQMVMALEDEFDVEIPTEELNSLETVADVINYLKSNGIEE